MSANLLVDVGATCDYATSVTVGSGSDLTVGRIVDLLGANTFCNVWAAGGVAGGSGPIQLQIQTSDSTTSGTFTDPTSGTSFFPSFIASGGNFWVNSGLAASGYSSVAAPVNNAPPFCSGGIQFGAFQRPHRYARLVLVSGTYPGAITAGFLSQKKFVGSGFGYSYLPGSGTVNV